MESQTASAMAVTERPPRPLEPAAATGGPVYSRESEATPGKPYYFAGQESTYAKQQETQALPAKLLG